MPFLTPPSRYPAHPQLLNKGEMKLGQQGWRCRWLPAIILATRTNLGCLLTVAELLVVQIWQDCVYEKAAKNLSHTV